MRIIAAVLSIMLLTTSSGAQEAASPGWDRLQSATSTEVELRLANGTSQRGTLERANEGSLELRAGSRQTSVTRDQIERVYELSGKSRKRGALIGAAIGGGAGAIVGAAIPLRCKAGSNCIGVNIGRGAGAAIIGVPGAVVGAVVGALLSRGKRKTLLYERAAGAR